MFKRLDKSVFLFDNYSCQLPFECTLTAFQKTSQFAYFGLMLTSFLVYINLTLVFLNYSRTILK